MKNHFFRLLKIYPFIIPVYLVFCTSCANQGVGPTGGPKDSIPPVIVNCIPAPLQTQFTGKEIEITFNEYVVADNLTEKLIISPPLGKKPTIRTKGKAIVVKIEEDLIPDRTYSIDFCDGLKDYNEGNKVKNLRLVFSTGKQLDTLRISGYIYDAITLEPVANALATLYTMDNDSIFRSLHPDFIARTDDLGFFLFDNLPPDDYKLYGVKDEDKNFYFSSQMEPIAFADSMIMPTANYVVKTDTIVTGNDTTISLGYTEFFPKDVNLLLFQDDQYAQYLVSFKREANDRCVLVFNEPVTDSLHIDLIGNDSIQNWKEIEFSQKLDSVSLWITDSLLTKKDTLFFRVSHPATDSLGETVILTDTLRMLYTKPVVTAKTAKEKPKTDENYFRFSTNISSSCDLNSTIIIEAQSPVQSPSDTLIKLIEIINDSTFTPVTCTLTPVEKTKRKYTLEFPLKENTKYELSIDTAVVKTFCGIPNAGFSTKFTTQKKDYYGSIILTLSGIERDGIIKLVKNNKDETVIKEFPYSRAIKTIVLDYLKPDKYLLKFIDDLNGNGQWDTGKLTEKRQPEPVYYLQKEVVVKSNWEIKENWEIVGGTIQGKAFAKVANENKKTGKQQ